MLFSKKSQIGETITWFVGFIIIFFIIILFLSASVISSGKKKVTTGWDEVKLQKYDSNLYSQRTLFNLLSTGVRIDSDERSIKEWLISDLYNMDSGKRAELREKIREELKKFRSTDSDCYFFQAYSGYSGKAPEEVSKNVDPRGAAYVGDFISKNSIQLGSYDSDNIDPRGRSYFSSAQEKLLKKSTSIILVRDTDTNIFGVKGEFEKVLVRLYVGSCY